MAAIRRESAMREVFINCIKVSVLSVIIGNPKVGPRDMGKPCWNMEVTY